MDREFEDRASELHRYLLVLRYRKWSVLVITSIVVAAVFVVLLTATPLYESEAEVLVRDPGTTERTVLPQGPNLETEKELAQSKAVASRVAEEAPASADQLLENLSVEVALNTEILVFRYLDPDPAQAQERAQGFAQAYLDYRREQVVDDLLASSQSIASRIDDLNRQIRALNTQIVDTEDETKSAALQSQANALIGQVAVLQQELAELTPPENLTVGQIVTPANLPASPARPEYVRDTLLAVVLGLALGIGWALLRERFDDRLRTQEDLERSAGVPVLAAIAKIPEWRRRDRTVVITLLEPTSHAAEAYRTLRTSILFSAAQNAAKTLMITSPHPADGKTATACNLAVVLAQAGKSTVLVSSDLRKPRVHRFFASDNSVGLTNVLAEQLDVSQALRPSGVDNLKLLLSGTIPGNPAELLGSQPMGELLTTLSANFDLVVLDAPPVLAVSDAVTLAPRAHMVLLVVDPENSHRRAVEEARRRLERVDARVIGTVLNNVDETKSDYGYYHRYGYSHQHPGVSGNGGRPRGRSWRAARGG